MHSDHTLEGTAGRLLVSINEARSLTDELFQIVRPDSLYLRPIPERHRIIFYLGHLEAFDWNLVGNHILELGPVHNEFDRLFAFGIDPVGGGLPADQPSDWPSISEVRRYNERVRQSLDAALAKVSFSDPRQPLRQEGFALHVALEHRLMHAETFAYMLHQLPLERKFLRPCPPALKVPPPAPRTVEIPPGTVTLGLSRSGSNEFGWDNEYEAHTVVVPEFAIDVYKVTNGQYLEFMAGGGYMERRFWAEAAWEWKTAEGISHPLFWTRRGNQWFCRTIFAEVPLPLDWPVYVSHAEASAYACWAGKTLPTEAQWHRAALGTPDGSEERSYAWGSEAPEAHHGNFDSYRWDPTPVGAYPSGNSAFDVADMVGNGWEWTSTLFEPFPGFEPFPFYPGYSANFFDGKHYVMKGGSARTAACLLRRSFRNWFQPHYPYVYAGFRCVANGS